MTRKPVDFTEAPGQDSFLDIVANLVGILIILVIVIGVRAKDAMLEAAPTHDSQQDIEQIAREMDDTHEAADALQADIHRIDRQIKGQQLDLEYRRKERDRVLVLVRTAEDLLAEKRSKLDEEQQQRFDVQRENIAARAALQQLRGGIESARSAVEQVTVIEHLPTPMAKTVFGKELHFRLRRGRLTFIPWDELVEQLQEDAPQKLWRLKDQPEFTETLGPLGGFWMKYTLKRIEHSVATKVGVAVQQGVELDHFVLVPVSENQGEPLDEALAAGSDFRALLSGHKPEHTTITVWTYPDSFNHFRTLKQQLYRLGYLTASRPLPGDQPIGGSPRGSRTAAQ